MDYITGYAYAESVPGAAPSRGLNALSRYGPALSRGNFLGSRDVYQSRGYCAAEQIQSKRFFLDASGEGRGYRDAGDLSAAIGYNVSEANLELLFNYRNNNRNRGRTGPIISSVYAGSRYFQLYSGGLFQNIPGLPPSCPVGQTADQPVVVMGYYNNDDSLYWLLRVPFGPTWGERGMMKLAKNVQGQSLTTGLCGLGTVVGIFLPTTVGSESPFQNPYPSLYC